MIVYPWREIEITLTAEHDAPNPYSEIEVWAEFSHDTGAVLRRPAFWDGGRIWKIRFASPLAEGRWTWCSFSSVEDSGLAGQAGEIACEAGSPAANRFYRHGFWRMSPGGRNLVHADGKPALLVGDTAWGLPWRATEEQCRVYAADRQAKGFNAVLLMSVQPDMRARGPRDRTADEGFEVGFEDLSEGHLNQLNPAYFQYLDRLLAILVEYELVPVLQPVFMGFGWKGLSVAGPVVPPPEYARYCRIWWPDMAPGLPSTWWEGTVQGTNPRSRPAGKRSSAGTPTNSRRGFIIAPTPTIAPGKRPPGWIFSGPRPATAVNISPNG